MLKLYGTPPTRALRVIWLLNELGLEYEMVPVDLLGGEQRKLDFLTLNPAAKVPRKSCTYPTDRISGASVASNGSASSVSSRVREPAPRDASGLFMS